MKTLYKKTSTGKIQQWSVIVKGNVIITIFGQKDGKLQETRDVITSGKNTGKRNQTTPEQQAQLEAEAQYQKKLKSGYVTTIDAASVGKRDAIIAGGIDPMLAHDFSKHGHKMIYPCFTQRKYDGIRILSHIPLTGKITLWTRTRKQIHSLPHIVEALEEFRQDKDIYLDGEAYRHDYRNDFEKIVSLVRPDKPVEGHEIVEYHVYDIADSNNQYEKRLETLMDRFGYIHDSGPIKFVETTKCKNESQVREMFAQYMQEGYEGAILRNPLTVYEHKRSYGLLKMKDFQDAEFEVIGVEEGRGKLMGCAGSMICKLTDGRAFNAKMQGSHENLREMFLHPPIGKMMTVKFQNYTSDGMPRFPVGLHLRDYE